MSKSQQVLPNKARMTKLNARHRISHFRVHRHQATDPAQSSVTGCKIITRLTRHLVHATNLKLLLFMLGQRRLQATSLAQLVRKRLRTNLSSATTLPASLSDVVGNFYKYMTPVFF